MNKCFAVCGNHPKLSKEEWNSLGAQNIQEPIRGLISFDREGELPLSHVGGSLKWGTQISTDEMKMLFEEADLLAVADDYDGMQFKRTYKIKRFKYVPINKTDKEIGEKGVELIRLDEHTETWGLVEYYHDIQRPETIEFQKPVSGMQVGMMPVKLVQMMINMGTGKAMSDGATSKSGAIAQKERVSGEYNSTDSLGQNNDIPHPERSEGSSESLTIYDPFCGFGTTGFIAHLSGHHFIGSDINPTPTKQNLPWRNEVYPDSKELFFTVFKHDVVEPFTQPFLKKVDAVVSEGRLGPVINNQLTHTRKENERRDIIAEIDHVYISFLEHFHALNPDATIVITYPQWTFWEEDMSFHFQRAGEKLGYTVENIGVYKRKGQYTGRRVIRMTV